MNTTERAAGIAAKVETFVREVVIPYERDDRRDHHGPSDALVTEMRAKARDAGELTPHILPDSTHLTQRETAVVLQKSGLSPLGPLACNTAAPDEDNMFLLGKVGTPEQKAHLLDPLARGEARSAFLMTEPTKDGGAGSDPSIMQTTCMPPHIDAGLVGVDVAGFGIPSEAEYFAKYCCRRGLDGSPGYDFYLASNFFRLAAIFHGIRCRVLNGTAASAKAKERIQVLPELMSLAWQQAKAAKTA